MVTRRQLAARIRVLLMLSGRGSTTCGSHLNISHVLLAVLLQVVDHSNRLPHLALNNFWVLHPIISGSLDRSLLTTVAVREGSCVGTNRCRVLGSQGLPRVEFLREGLVLLLEHGGGGRGHYRLVCLAAIVCPCDVHGVI